MEYGDTNNDSENYERDNNENRQNKTIAIDTQIITIKKKLEVIQQKEQLDMMQKDERLFF